MEMLDPIVKFPSLCTTKLLAPGFCIFQALKAVFFIDENGFVHSISCVIDLRWTLYWIQLKPSAHKSLRVFHTSTGSMNFTYTFLKLHFSNHIQLTAQARRTISPREPAAETQKDGEKESMKVTFENKRTDNSRYV